MVKSKLIYLFILIILLLISSSFGIILIESHQPWTFIDAIYFMMITLTTIGYGEVHTLSNYGRIYIIFIMITGLSLFGYSLSVILHIVLNDYLGDYFKNLSLKKKMKDINELENHYIICGYGYLGKYIASELKKLAFNIVIIEFLTDELQKKIPENLKNFFISGYPDDDENLVASGIKKAKTIIVVTDQDHSNIYITMNARILNPEIYIISSYTLHRNKQKIIVAGANKIIPIYALASMEILEHIFNRFLDFSVGSGTIEKAIELDEIVSDLFVINNRSNLYQKLGLEIAIKSKLDYNIKIIAIIEKNGKFHHDFHSIKLKDNYKILMLGKELDIEIFKLKNS